MKVQSIEYFACARSIFSKLDIWTPRYLGAKYLILCTCKKYFFWSWIYGPPGIYVKSIEHFARARSIFSKLDIWTPRYLGAKYWILCRARTIFSKLDKWIPRYSGAKYWILCMCKKYLFFKLDRLTPRNLDAKYWILWTCKKYFF